MQIKVVIEIHQVLFRGTILKRLRTNGLDIPLMQIQFLRFVLYTWFLSSRLYGAYQKAILNDIVFIICSIFVKKLERGKDHTFYVILQGFSEKSFFYFILNVLYLYEKCLVIPFGNSLP